MNDSLKELLKFVQIGARLDLKAVAVENVLGLTASASGIEALIELPTLLWSLVALLDDNNSTIAKDAALSLINISAHEKGAELLVDLDSTHNSLPLQTPPDPIVDTTLKFIFNPQSRLADECCMILSNVSRPSHLIDKIVDRIDKSFEQMIDVFTKISYNKTGAKLDYLGPVLSNLSQTSRIRKRVCDANRTLLVRLLPYTEYEASLVRRGGVVGMLRNCCFDADYHEWLLSEEIDILPRLLLPLAGNEEFDEEDNDKLPLDLQYLPENKVRDDDPDIRCMLLEALTQLCTKRKNRELIRDRNAYVILRELHKWEKDRKALAACENLVDILIRTEDEIGEDDLKQVKVPEELSSQFKDADDEYLNS